MFKFVAIKKTLKLGQKDTYSNSQGRCVTAIRAYTVYQNPKTLFFPFSAPRAKLQTLAFHFPPFNFSILGFQHLHQSQYQSTIHNPQWCCRSSCSLLSNRPYWARRLRARLKEWSSCTPFATLSPPSSPSFPIRYGPISSISFGLRAQWRTRKEHGSVEIFKIS